LSGIKKICARLVWIWKHFADGQALPGGGMARGHVYIPRSDLEKLPDLKLTSAETGTLATLLLYALEHAESERERELLRSSASKLLFRAPGLLRDGSTAKDFWTPGKSKPDEQLALARRAIQKRLVLELEYPDRGGGTAVRKVRPRGLISHRGRWCLVCHTHDGLAVRYFYVDRIVSLKAGKTHFPPDPAFNIKAHSLHPLLLKIHAPEPIQILAHKEHLDTVLDFLSGLPDMKVRDRAIDFKTTNKSAVFSFVPAPSGLCGANRTCCCSQRNDFIPQEHPGALRMKPAKKSGQAEGKTQKTSRLPEKKKASARKAEDTRFTRDMKRILSLIPVLTANPGIRLADLQKLSGYQSKKKLQQDLEKVLYFGRPPFTPADYIDICIEEDRVFLELPQGLDRPLELTIDEWALVQSLITQTLEFYTRERGSRSELASILEKMTRVPLALDYGPYTQKARNPAALHRRTPAGGVSLQKSFCSRRRNPPD
jgi:predicted DNA-binding transcriptional regulator YafY